MTPAEIKLDALHFVASLKMNENVKELKDILDQAQLINDFLFAKRPDPNAN